MSNPELEARARLYATCRGRAIDVPLGDGTDGCVWQTDRKTAIKVFERQQNFDTELACYQLFHERDITEICGYAIPRLIEFSREVKVIEMGIVEPPYILDFGKAYVHRKPPALPAETMAETIAARKKLWGEHWPEVRSILVRLAAMGIHHMDPRPGNIRPANWNPTLDDD